MGITVDSELGITVGNLSNLKTLELDGIETEIASLESLTECSSLKELTLKNITLNNLNGLDNLALLNFLYLKNCNIGNYNALESCYNLKYLYFLMDSGLSETISNANVLALGNSLSNASHLGKLEYFGIFGSQIESISPDWGVGLSQNSFCNWSGGISNNVTDLSPLRNFNDVIKKSVKYCYFFNDGIASVDFLSGFDNLCEVVVAMNPNLTTLSGLENKSNLTNLSACRCGLTSISSLIGSSSLKWCCIQRNKIASLDGLEDSKTLLYLVADNNMLTDIDVLEDCCTSLYLLQLNANVSLTKISAISNCGKVKRIYLAGNENMDTEEIPLIVPIINNCGSYYSIPSKFLLYLDGATSYDFKDFRLTDSSVEINAMKNKTDVKRLRLADNSDLSNDKLNEVLSTMTGLEFLSLTNLGNLTSIDFIKKVPNLIELDLRGTSVTSNTDITLLNAYGTKLKNLLIDNDDIVVKDIEPTFVNVISNFESTYIDSWLNQSYEYLRGVICQSPEYDFSALTELTSWKCYQLSFPSTDVFFDFSNCSKMKSVRVYGSPRIKLPESIESVFCGNGLPELDLGLCKNLVSLVGSNCDGSSLRSAAVSLPGDNNLVTFSSYNCSNSWSDLNFLGEFDTNSLRTLNVYGWERHTNGLADLTGLQFASGLTHVEFHYSSVSSLSGIQYLTNLEAIYVYGTFNKISDISLISNLTKLKTVHFGNQNISKIPELRKLKNAGCTIINIADNNFSTSFSL